MARYKRTQIPIKHITGEDHFNKSTPLRQNVNTLISSVLVLINRGGLTRTHASTNSANLEKIPRTSRSGMARLQGLSRPHAVGKRPWCGSIVLTSG